MRISNYLKGKLSVMTIHYRITTGSKDALIKLLNMINNDYISSTIVTVESFSLYEIIWYKSNSNVFEIYTNDESIITNLRLSLDGVNTFKKIS